jgi:hypothetical protein
MSSSRITKALSEEIARKLVEPKKKELEELNEKKRSIAEKRAWEDLPEEVIKLAQSHPEYVQCKNSARVYGPDIVDHVNETFDKPLPVKDTWAPKIVLNKDESKEYFDLLTKSRNIAQSIYELKHKIEVAVYNLRTYKRIREEFPEASKYLPNGKKKTGLAIRLDEIRKELKDNS